jgi:hypothetical protein
MRCTLVQVSSLLVLAVLESSCGDGKSTLPPSAPLRSTVPTPTLLRTLYRVLSGGDRMTAVGPDERSSYLLEGQVYYVPDQPATGRSTLNRVISFGGTDHADTIGNLSGYSQDTLLGFPWTSASGSGVAQLSESLNSATGDYALLAPSENLPGYSPQPIAAYGYPRFGNASEVLLSLSAGGVTVQSNAVAGGATWRWFWNGIQFVNHADYGREIQAAFYYGKTVDLDPNEAGDQLTFDFQDPSIKHGSPILQFENQGTTQITRAVPLNWLPTVFGGDQDHPVIWDSLVLGKDLTLDFNNLGPVARYTTHLTLPSAAEGGIQNPVGYLLSSFDRYWTYDAGSQTLTEVTNVIPDGCTANSDTAFGGYAFFVDFGGIIMSDASGANAMGVYAVGVGHGGSVSYLAMFKFFCWGDGPSETSSDTTAWSGVSGNGTVPAGETTYNVYLITDSVQNVTARMDDLFRMGVR